MQYFGRAIGSVSKTWSSLNPATLSGAIDVIVVDHPDGTLACSPFHVRFGKFQILQPSQKKVEVLVNGKSTNIPMKLGDSGEAYFVFETTSDVEGIPNELLSSPVISATSSPPESPKSSRTELDNSYEISTNDEDNENNNENENNDNSNDRRGNSNDQKKESSGPSTLEEPDFLDINDVGPDADLNIPLLTGKDSVPISKTKIFQEKLNKKLTQIHIPSKLDNNGDLLLDIEGYKPNKDKVHNADNQLKQLLQEELGTEFDISNFIKEDSEGNVRIVNPFEKHLGTPLVSPPASADESASNLESKFDSADSSAFSLSSDSESHLESKENSETSSGHHYIKTLRLSSDQLKCLDLKYGENEVTFSVDQGRAVTTAKLFVWRWDVPIVISDIDGTITKSDALGHVLTMLGKDWTHVGVAKLFSEIYKNGYNVMYLTARSAGQADSTRSYLRSISQNGNHLPAGPVILSPDRTMAALRREVILKKPEVFKIACLNDIRSLYFDQKSMKGESVDDEEGENPDEKPTPFFAGFGNRITDALSYRTVGIPSSRIFTINTEGEVHMELLELAGYKSSYVFINELVDHFFPPVACIDDEQRSIASTPGSPQNNTMDMEANTDSNFLFRSNQENRFTDANFWREPILKLDDLSELNDSDVEQPSEARPLATDKKESSELHKYNTGDRSWSSQYDADLCTPKKKRATSSRDEIGKRIYLGLGSPLSSPKINYIDTKDLAQGLDKISLSKPAPAISGVSKVSVMDDVHSPSTKEAGQLSSDHDGDDEYNHDTDEEEEGLDDEFDEDEFIDT
ncbi:hypothetical protein HG535_0D01430 [Zygotorulaspora mrakii]|uniref:LNS2/PITP domain-containing protein n=1 Tax=Zygotorulaspora mrakii TaxID=42260 RepID=A0A7H9B188_ZYGMR|nr:uncharacterized protein HG535_0D01430 [Zygotorulaspora mrakii]QLG72435.1 hypothetical protein HG535_0D01430 [Zygotorulaspora mrakii]